MPLDAAAVGNIVPASSVLDDATAYAITRALPDRTAQLAATSPAATATRSGNAGASGFLPFHPGALRLYNEPGTPIPLP